MKIIAYGSLMKQNSLETTLRRPAKLNKTTVAGWKRVFNAPFDGYAFLNLVASPAVTIESAWFEASSSEAQFLQNEKLARN
jgi:hypothetical protein